MARRLLVDCRPSLVQDRIPELRSQDRWGYLSLGYSSERCYEQLFEAQITRWDFKLLITVKLFVVLTGVKSLRPGKLRSLFAGSHSWLSSMEARLSPVQKLTIDLIENNYFWSFFLSNVIDWLKLRFSKMAPEPGGQLRTVQCLLALQLERKKTFFSSNLEGENLYSTINCSF